MHLKLYSLIGSTLRNSKILSSKPLYKQLLFNFPSTKKNKKIIEKPQTLASNQTQNVNQPQNSSDNKSAELSEKKQMENLIKDLQTKRFIYKEGNKDITIVESESQKAAKKNENPQQSENIPEIKTERLSKYLSRAGVCSRREAERLISKGMIFVNKKKVDSNIAVTDKCDIKIFSKDGSKVPLKESSRLWMFYKPRGLVCSLFDKENRPTVYQYLKEKEKLNMDHIICVGNMDYNAEGLLLFTNNGELARSLELPVSKIEKSYHVRVYGTFTPDKLSNIRKGVIIKGKKYGPFWTEILNRQTSNTWLFMKTDSGKVRELRRIIQKFDLRVNRLKRVAYGPYRIGGLVPGDLVELKVAPEIKKVIYNSTRHKLIELKEKKEEKLLVGNEMKGIGQETVQLKKIDAEQSDKKSNKIENKRSSFLLK